MSPRRRTVLAGTGIAAAGLLGVGYWQRRRISRRSAIDDLHAVSGIDVPRVDAEPIITPALLESAYDRAIERFDEVEPHIEPPLDRYSTEFVDDLRERLEDNAPHDLTVGTGGPPWIHAERRQALLTYRRTRSRIVSILAQEAPDRKPREAFESQSAAVRDRIDSLEIPYRGETLEDAIVAAATIESSTDAAERRLEGARERTDRSNRWRHLERATAAIEDADAAAEVQTGPDRSAALRALAERLVDEVKRYREATPDWNDPPIEGAETSFATTALTTLQRPMRSLGAAGYAARQPLELEEYGRAALTHALLLPAMGLDEAFADVPAPVWWDEIEYDHGATPGDLRAEKEATIEAAEEYLDRDDPLVAHLAAVPLGTVRNVDRRLESLLADVRGYDDREWSVRLDSASLRYEAARRYADAIDEALDVIAETEAVVTAE